MSRHRHALAIALAALSLAGGLAACETGDGGTGTYQARPDFGAGEASPPEADAAPPEADSAPLPPPTIEDVRAVVPGPGLPDEIAPQAANNNLDLVEHAGRLYLAFRTGPSHFASPDVRLYVMSTEDELDWRFEGDFHEGTDLREPRLVSLNGRLFLYYAVLGMDRLAFEPQGMKVTEQLADGSWSAPEWFYGEGYIPWRARVRDGEVFMTTYVGGENLYAPDGDPIVVHWVKSADGRNFEPVVSGHSEVLRGGTSETDLARLDDGTVIAVARNEGGDLESGFGSKICRGEADAPADWRCATDKRRFDSPLVFRHRDAVYLIGRRHVTDDGAYDLGRSDLSLAEQSAIYAAAYWNKPKRCTLWRVDPDALTATFVLDLPSRGDTCFASAVPRGDDAFLIYNYSSPIDGPDVGWLAGQTGDTLLYRQILRFPTPVTDR